MPVNTLAIAATRTAVQQLVKQFLPHITSPLLKKKLFKEFENQLRYLRLDESQTQYVLKQISQPACLKNLAKLITIEDVRSEIVRALNYPEHLHTGDARITEMSLATMALIRALVIVNAPDPHHALTADLLLLSLSNTSVIFPGIGEVLEEHHRREKAPLATSSDNIARLLQRAGQSSLQLTLSADQVPQVSGTAHVTLDLPPVHLDAMKKWISDTNSERLILKWADGAMRVSYGDPELDKLLSPPGKFNLHLVAQPVVYHLRLKVRNGTETRFLSATMTFYPGDMGRTVTIGHERFMLKIYSSSLDEDRKVKVQVTYNTGGYALSPEDEILLEGLLLLMRPGGQALILRGEQPSTGHIVEVDHPKPFIQTPNSAKNQDFIAPIKFHLTLLRLAQLAVKRGFDPLTLTIPEQFDEGHIESLLAIGQIMERISDGYIGVFFMDIEKESFSKLESYWSEMDVTHRCTFRIGETYFFAEQSIKDIRLLEKKKKKNLLCLKLEGEFQESVIEALTYEQLEEKWSN